MENDVSNKRFLLGSYEWLNDLYKISTELDLHPHIEQTVFAGNPSVYFTPGAKPEEQEERLEMLLNHIQPTYSGSMKPYKVDEQMAQKFHKHMKRHLSKTEPDIELVVGDITGKHIAGEASNICGAELLSAGVPCYVFGADPIQITVLKDKNAGLYAMRLPADPFSEMFAVTKTDFPAPKLLEEMEMITRFLKDYDDVVKKRDATE